MARKGTSRHAARSAYAVAVGCLLLAWPAQAQIANVQSLIAKETPGWTGQFDGSFDFRSWNNQQTLLGAGAVVRYVRDNNLVLLVGRGDMIKRGSADWQERHLEHVRYRHRFDSTVFDAEAFVQHSTDVFRRLQNRFLIGAGPRVRVLSGPILSLAVGLIPMFEFERLGDGNFSDAGLTRQRGRLSNYVVLSTHVGERLFVRHSVYIQSRFDDWNDTRVLNEFEASVALSKTFAFKWTLVGLIDPRPPKGIVPVDTTAKSSLVLTL